MLSIFVLTETIDYNAPFTSHAVAIQVLLGGREGEGWGSSLDPNFGKKCGVRGCVLNPRKPAILYIICLMKLLRYLAQFTSLSPYKFCLGTLPNKIR